MEAVLQNSSKPPLTAFKPDLAPFVVNNWKMLQANAEPYLVYNRYVKVSERVASITNGQVILRSPLDLPNGFYVITEENEFVKTPFDSEYKWTRFPDVDAAMPAFERIDYTPPFTRDGVLRMVEFCNYARKHSRSGDLNLFIQGEVMSIIGDSTTWLQLQHPIPVKPSGLIFGAYNLKLAFTEMLRYDAIHIGYDNVSAYKQPLVIGLDWGHCALCTTA